MTENTTESDGIDASELFARASELPESNYAARTLAQKLACVAVEEEPGR